MPLLIDAYNVLHTVGILPPDLAGIDVMGLVELLRRSRYRPEVTTLVCDGQPPQDRSSLPPANDAQFRVRFSGAGKPADDLIGQLIRASTAPRRLIVVSSDHAVQRNARKRRCHVLSSEEFLRHLVEDASLTPQSRPAKPAAGGAMTSKQVDGWLKVFNVDEQAIEAETKKAIRRERLKRPPKPMAPAAGTNSPVDLTGKEPPAPVLPQDLIEEAERILAENRQKPLS